ncbi:MAG: flavin reductase family protein [Pseudomonadales bacterium]|nr:flavin reductase family protein [Pseudomonadales bacterium]
MFRVVEPAVLYFGTQVVLINTMNKDGSTNIAANSSVWWLGWTCMLGIDATSKTTENLLANGECVLNLPGFENADLVDRVALTTGCSKVPAHKKILGYRSVKDKFTLAEASALASDRVRAPRIAECPVQLEARVAKVHTIGAGHKDKPLPTKAFELNIERVHVNEKLIMEGSHSKIDPDRWNPLMMNFRELYGLTSKARSSKLAAGTDAIYAPWRLGKAGRWLSARMAKKIERQKLRAGVAKNTEVCND